ncbi:aminopeptidase P N-terminal domain-containing protein [Candidatus Venteria ishoeyi]|uniref:Xaa-Pro aminopeptidase n=1 Tax=Candidatus Venteria ishoeyi TaxID=1899563 RepID=A0A1H6FDE5_9GAMM|nr:aminopeptidase P N-terminal domain-containing protein [Candidatus Venteria ishoeyi]SEH07673.1 Xaa-Pro aminopeptidase [Candidatus Venteria ishoeyi]
MKSALQQEYQQRRQQFMRKLSKQAQSADVVVVIPSAPMAIMHRDVEYRYRQNSDFFYLTGFDEPNAVAVLAPGQKHEFVLFVQAKDPLMETWSGRRIGVEQAQVLYGADRAFTIDKLDKVLPRYLQRANQLYYIADIDEKQDQRIFSHWKQQIHAYPKTGQGILGLTDASRVLHEMRMYKSPLEIAQLRKAMAISIAAHQQAHHHCAPGKHEYEIQALMEQLFLSAGAESFAYPSIVASGDNACILHYINNNHKMVQGNLLLIDAGCSVGYYNADITRTFPVGKRFTPEQKALYEIVLAAQLAAIDAVKPGQRFHKVHSAAAKVITEGLLELGLLRGKLEKLIKKQAWKSFFPHGTSHWLGLDVHDVGCYRDAKNPDKKSRKLRSGNVLTIEPGIYIAPDFIPAKGQPEVADCWRGIGIRIEDNVLVTNKGHEVLTALLPKSIGAMERG